VNVSKHCSRQAADTGPFELSEDILLRCKQPKTRRLTVFASLAIAGCGLAGAHVELKDKTELMTMSGDPVRSGFSKYFVEPNAAIVRIQPTKSAKLSAIATVVCLQLRSVDEIKFYDSYASEQALNDESVSSTETVKCSTYRATPAASP
jgi:hypothetical protein